MSDLATLSALKARVEAATGRSSDTEAHLICALAAPEGCFVTRGPIYGDYRVCVGQTPTGRDLAWAGWAYWRDRNVMGDIGAALALVEEAAPGWQWLVRNREDGQYLANLRPAGSKPNEGDPCWPAWASTAPLAILSALLTAKIARLRAENERLAHLCRLGSIVVSQIRDPDFPRWLAEEADDGERQSTMTGLQILADAFVELARRQEMLPRFAVPGRTAKAPGQTEPSHAV